VLTDSNPCKSLFTCQATISDGKWSAWDSCAPWCPQDAVTTIPLTLIAHERVAHVWVCQEHYDEYVRHIDI
jgi:hypothetical protein